MQAEADQLLTINVMLAGRSYRIRVAAAQEGALRKAVKNADEQIKDLRLHYAGKDDQDFISMCLLMYAAERSADPALIAEAAIANMVHSIDAALL